MKWIRGKNRQWEFQTFSLSQCSSEELMPNLEAQKQEHYREPKTSYYISQGKQLLRQIDKVIYEIHAKTYM